MEAFLLICKSKVSTALPSYKLSSQDCLEKAGLSCTASSAVASISVWTGEEETLKSSPEASKWQLPQMKGKMLKQ